VKFHQRLTICWTRTAPDSSRPPNGFESRLEGRWDLPVFTTSEPVLRLLARCLYRRPVRLVLVDPRDAIPLGVVRVLTLISHVTVYNQHGDSFDVDAAHVAPIRDYFSRTERFSSTSLPTIHRWTFATAILLRAAGRLLVGYTVGSLRLARRTQTLR
jgi:hypothetical protein